jgi:hypothetical protein
MEKYAVLNPLTGDYEYAENEDSAKNLLANIVYNFYKAHAHGVSYTKIYIDENGAETWHSENISTEIPINILEKLVEKF